MGLGGGFWVLCDLGVLPNRYTLALADPRKFINIYLHYYPHYSAPSNTFLHILIRSPSFPVIGSYSGIGTALAFVAFSRVSPEFARQKLLCQCGGSFISMKSQPVFSLSLLLFAGLLGVVLRIS